MGPRAPLRARKLCSAWNHLLRTRIAGTWDLDRAALDAVFVLRAVQRGLTERGPLWFKAEAGWVNRNKAGEAHRMTKRQRLRSLEERIGQLEGHIRARCPHPALTDFAIKRLPDEVVEAAIAKRLAWLRANNEKERMGRKRY